MSNSYLERITAALIKEASFPMPIREFKLIESRKWLFDFVWVKEKVILEVEGGIWNIGRHQRPEGFTKDCEKYNEATLLGFKVLRVTKYHLISGQAMDWVKKALEL